MTLPQKIPYAKMEYPTAFSFTKKWIEYKAEKGCVPLGTQTGVSMERLLPDEIPPSKLEKSTKESKQANQQDASKNSGKSAAQQQQKENTGELAKEKGNTEKGKKNVEQQCMALPAFDMLDIPATMRKMKFPLGAELSEKWFNGRKYIYNNDPAAIQPLIDTETVSLDWVLRYKPVKKIYDELVTEKIYTDNATKTMKTCIARYIKKNLSKDMKISPVLDSMKISKGDLQLLHRDFQFQNSPVSDFDTLDGITMTDLTASLGNFGLLAAVANCTIHLDRYFKYERTEDMFCCEANVSVTHIYVYAKDSYSFNDKEADKNSQYLGHWNRKEVILVMDDLFQTLANRKDFPLRLPGTNRPVYTPPRDLGKITSEDVFYPIYNRDYNAWREKHNHGGDFMIYTMPQRLKLPEPIQFVLKEICRPSPKY